MNLGGRDGGDDTVDFQSNFTQEGERRIFSPLSRPQLATEDTALINMDRRDCGWYVVVGFLPPRLMNQFRNIYGQSLCSPFKCEIVFCRGQEDLCIGRQAGRQADQLSADAD